MGSTPEEIDNLTQEGNNLIGQGLYDDAVKVGKKLLKQRHSSAFEVLALAYAGQGKMKKAIKTLETGVEKAPTVWTLWQLLGNYRSEIEMYDQAHEAYANALACPEVWASSVHLNIAIALARQERDKEANSHLDLVDDPQMRPRADAQRMAILMKQNRYHDALVIGSDCLEGMDDSGETEPYAGVAAALGEAFWHGHQNGEQAVACAEMACMFQPAQPSALWLIREIEGHLSPNARYFRLLIEGDWNEPDEDGKALGFFISYDVVADDPAQALEYLRRFEPPEVRSSLCISEYEDIEARPDEPTGVYTYQAHNLFPHEEE